MKIGNILKLYLIEIKMTENWLFKLLNNVNLMNNFYNLFQLD